MGTDQDEKSEPPSPQPLSLFVGRHWSPWDYLRPQRWNWRALLRPIDQQIGRQSALRLPWLKVVGLRWFWLDGLFSTISENFYVSFVPLLALAIGATGGQIGLLTAVANLMGTAAFLPGAWVAERLVRRKPLVLAAGGGVGRLAVLAVSVVPLLYQDPGLAIALIIGLHGLRSFASNFANPAWTAMVADLVPSPMRGRYFGGRNVAMAVAALIVSPLAGWIVRLHAASGRELFGYQIAFFLAFAFGMLGTLSFSRIPEPRGPLAAAPRAALAGVLALAKRNPVFVRYVASMLVWSVSIQVAGPFFNVYFVSDLGGDASMVGIAAAVSSLATLAGQFFFAPIVDRRGVLAVQRVMGFFVPLLPFFWIFASSPWHAYLINAYGGFVWAGYNLCNFNLLLELSPQEDRRTAVAVFQTAMFATAVVGPLAGGYLAEAVGYRLIFGLSTAGRLLGTLLLVALVRPRRQAEGAGAMAR